MMDHIEDKPRDIFWDMNQHNIVNYLRNLNQLEGKYTELEINHVIGALEVNAFETTTKKVNHFHMKIQQLSRRAFFVWGKMLNLPQRLIPPKSWALKIP